MKRILIRAGMSPFEQPSIEQILVENLLGNNNGNLLYQFSIFRTLQLDNVKLIPNRYNFDPKQADYINATYDHFVLPFANAFRDAPRALTELRNYTKLIRKLTIPITVAGIGLQAPVNAKVGQSYSFDDEVKEFMVAVLEKTNIVGVRGRITASYLQSLGFKEDQDFTVIGCPSMYAFGRELKIRPLKLTDDSHIYANSVPEPPSTKNVSIFNFINNSMAKSNHIFVPTENRELELTYAGVGSFSSKLNNYPSSMLSSVYSEGRVRFPVSATTWVDMLKDADLVYGARLHGCIAATLAGTPSIMFVKDSRMQELAEYHDLTRVYPAEVGENVSLEDIVKHVDFQSATTKHAEKFDRFIDFLNQNGLDHIYKKTKSPENIPFDTMLAKVKLTEPISPVSTQSSEETVHRQTNLMFAKEQVKKQIVAEYKQQLKQQNDLLRLQKDAIKGQRKQLKSYKATLNRRSVRVALKLASLVRHYVP